MKHKVEERYFTPVVLTLTFETVHELTDLWHKLNIATADVIGNSKEFKHRFPGIKNQTDCNIEVFKIIDSILTNLNIKNNEHSF